MMDFQAQPMKEEDLTPLFQDVMDVVSCFKIKDVMEGPVLVQQAMLPANLVPVLQFLLQDIREAKMPHPITLAYILTSVYGENEASVFLHVRVFNAEEESVDVWYGRSEKGPEMYPYAPIHRGIFSRGRSCIPILPMMIKSSINTIELCLKVWARNESPEFRESYQKQQGPNLCLPSCTPSLQKVNLFCHVINVIVFYESLPLD
jgi:hypothetical protein